MIEEKKLFPCLEPRVAGLCDQRKEWHLESFEAELLNALVAQYLAMLRRFDDGDMKNFWRHRFAAEEVYKRLRSTRS